MNTSETREHEDFLLDLGTVSEETKGDTGLEFEQNDASFRAP